jgi:hypothetical protein
VFPLGVDGDFGLIDFFAFEEVFDDGAIDLFLAAALFFDVGAFVRIDAGGGGFGLGVGE